MVSRFALALVAVIGIAISATAQQVVRFETTHGSFDMVLNPTNNPILNEYAQNMVDYVTNNNYLGSWINRASKNQDGSNFVLQMGGFFSNTKRPSPTITSVNSVQTFAPVQGQPAAQNGLSNTVGTVALALPGSSSGTDRDAGTSSFFVNLADNNFLDPDFTVFAKIADMTTINNIMALSTVDRTADANFGAGNGNLGFSEVPVGTDGYQVFIKRAFLVTDTLTISKDLAAVGAVSSQSTAAALQSLSALSSGGGASLPGSLSATSTVVPEPTTAAIALLGSLGFGCVSRRRRR
jgi:cyclophilin family peptidyl-prolyl cis-trans isomerase